VSPALVDPNSPYVGRRAAPPAGTTTTRTATTAKKQAAPFDWTAFANSVFAPIDYSGLAKVASGRAASDTDALVAGYKTLQSDALAQASARAAQQGQLGLDTSRYLEWLNLGGLAAGDYANAAAAQRAAAAGYSGGLQQTVSDEAAKVQANLAAAGSSQTALNQGQAAGNALYGLGGNLPALQLDAIGPTVAAGLRALPAQTLGYGQQLAFGELGQGQQEAAKLNAEIVTARAKQGALAASYLDKLSEVARESGQDRISNYYKALAIKMKADATTAEGRQIDAAASKVVGHIVYKDGTEPTDAKGNLIPIAAGAARLHYSQDSFGRDVVFDPTTGKRTVMSSGQFKDDSGNIYAVGLTGKMDLISAGKPDAPTRLDTVSDQTGTYIWDPYTGQRGRKIAGPPASATRAPSDVAQTAPPRFDSANSNAQGFRSDQYGDPIPGRNKQPVLMPGWRRGASGMPVKIGKGPKPYRIPAGISERAQEMAYGLVGIDPAHPTDPPIGEAKLYGVAFKQLVALMHGSGVPLAAARKAARDLLVSVGYDPDLGANIGAGIKGTTGRALDILTGA
jgi:hypothetical protein